MMSESSTSLSQTVVCKTNEASCDAVDPSVSKAWLRVGIAGVFAGQGMVFSLAVNMTPPAYGSTGYWIVHGGLALSSLLVILFLGGPLFRSTWGMFEARRLSIEGLFTLSLVGALVGSLVSSIVGEGSVYYEVVSIVIAIYTIGRMVGERAKGKITAESERLRDCFDTVSVIGEGDVVHRMPVGQVKPGMRVRISPGEAVGADGVILSGVGFVRETALTGEPAAVVRRAGDRVRAGTWSVDGVFEVDVVASGGHRELDRILAAVEDRSGKPSELQTQANDLIQFFLPLVAGVSVATAIYWTWMGTWVEAVLSSMSVLLVACPCALGLATPVAIWQGLFQLAKLGLVSRDGSLLDVLAQTRRIFFDKTGTLSVARMAVVETYLMPGWEDRRVELLSAVSKIEERVNHPIGSSLVDALIDEIGESVELAIATIDVVPGLGISAEVAFSGSQSARIRIGEAGLVEAVSGHVQNAVDELMTRGGRRVFLFVDDSLAGVFVLKEELREGVDSVWRALRELGVKATILTGDSQPEISLPSSVEVCARMTSDEKASRVRESVAAAELPLYIGDGINDAAAMVDASGAIAMEAGAGLTRSAAVGEFTGDRIHALIPAIRLARLARRRLRGNLRYAICYNVVGMVLAATGYLHPIFAALIMLVSSLFVTIRALRPYPSV